MLEAKQLGVDYKTLEFFANELAIKTNLKDIFNVENILEKMGCKIKDISMEKWQNQNFNYVEIQDEKNFTVTVCSELGDEMKRFSLIQGLSHYVLHGNTGKKSCYVKSMIEGEVAREGLIFTLCFLIPDELLRLMILDGYSKEELSNFFRLPLGMIDIKLNLLKTK